MRSFYNAFSVVIIRRKEIIYRIHLTVLDETAWYRSILKHLKMRKRLGMADKKAWKANRQSLYTKFFISFNDLRSPEFYKMHNAILL